MDVKALARLVAEMRRAQKEFFDSGNRAALSEAKRLEVVVDREIAALLDAQQRLFGDYDSELTR